MSVHSRQVLNLEGRMHPAAHRAVPRPPAITNMPRPPARRPLHSRADISIGMTKAIDGLATRQQPPASATPHTATPRRLAATVHTTETPQRSCEESRLNFEADYDAALSAAKGSAFKAFRDTGDVILCIDS